MVVSAADHISVNRWSGSNEVEFTLIFGIPEDEVNRIFERFYRVDKTRDRETGGTGLGLSITHSTIMMHKGSIKVNSKEEEGTTILVRIPLKQPTTHG